MTKKYTVVVAKTAQFEIEADNHRQARILADRLLDEENKKVMSQIDQTIWGWDVTDVTEKDE